MKLSIAFSKKTNLVKTVIRLIFSRKFNISLNIYLKLTKLNKVLTIPEYSKMVICKNAIAASWDTKCKRSCLSLVINDDGYLYISKDNHWKLYHKAIELDLSHYETFLSTEDLRKTAMNQHSGLYLGNFFMQEKLTLFEQLVVYNMILKFNFDPNIISLSLSKPIAKLIKKNQEAKKTIIGDFYKIKRDLMLYDDKIYIFSAATFNIVKRRGLQNFSYPRKDIMIRNLLDIKFT